MGSITKTILLFALAVMSTTTRAATADEVQKAYENCVVSQTASVSPERFDTPEARKAWGVESCSKTRGLMCPTPDGRFCDGWVKDWLYSRSRLETSEMMKITLPHSEYFERPSE